MNLQPATSAEPEPGGAAWMAGSGSLNSQLDDILAQNFDASLPDSLPEESGSLLSRAGSRERMGTWESLASHASPGGGGRDRMASMASMTSLPSPGADLFNLFPSQPAPAARSMLHDELGADSPAEYRNPVPTQPLRPAVPAAAVPDKAATPRQVRVANTSVTLEWDALRGSEAAGLWYHLYRVDPAAEGEEPTTLIYSTQDTNFLKHTCGGLTEGEEYHFGMVVESNDRTSHSEISDLLSVRVGLNCMFEKWHSKGAGAKGRVRVQEKPFSRVNWVELVTPPPPMCERCTSTLRKHFNNQTTSKGLAVDFLCHVVRIRCKKCQEWVPAEECQMSEDFLCPRHSNPPRAPGLAPPRRAAQGAAGGGAAAASAGGWPEQPAAMDVGALGGLMSRTSITEEDSGVSPASTASASETDREQSERLVRHKVEQLFGRLKEANFGQLLEAPYGERTEDELLDADGFTQTSRKRKMVGKSFQSVVTAQLGDLMVVVFENMRDRVAQLPSYILPKWHATYNTTSFDELWQLEQARSELVQEVIQREDFGRRLLHAVKRAADEGELAASHAALLNRPEFFDCWNGVLAQSGCVMVVYTCAHGAAAAAASIVASRPAAFAAGGISAVAPLVGGAISGVVCTGLRVQDHDSLFGGLTVPLDGTREVLQRLIEERYDAEALQWIAAQPEVCEWLDVENMSLLHTAALSGAHEVAVALLSATTSLAGSAAATAEAAQRRDVHGKSALDYAALMDDDALYNELAAALPTSTKLEPLPESLAASELSEPQLSPYQENLRERADSILSQIARGDSLPSMGRGSLSTEARAQPAVMQTAEAAAALAAGAEVVRATIVGCQAINPPKTKGSRAKPFVEYRIVVEAADGADGATQQWEIRPRFSEFKSLHASLSKHSSSESLKLVGRKGPTKTGVLSKLPSSLHWFNNTSSKFIERRRAGLQEYLDKLLAPGSKLKSDTAVSDFLGVRPSVAVPA